MDNQQHYAKCQLWAEIGRVPEGTREYQRILARILGSTRKYQRKYQSIRESKSILGV
jgi:hypothetical protein